jgi:hypothetical protein
MNETLNSIGIIITGVVFIVLLTLVIITYLKFAQKALGCSKPDDSVPEGFPKSKKEFDKMANEIAQHAAAEAIEVANGKINDQLEDVVNKTIEKRVKAREAAEAEEAAKK